MDRRRSRFSSIRARYCAPFAAFCAVAAVLAFVGTADAQTLGSCKLCRDYDRACRGAHSKEVCKSELDKCLKHCTQKK
jgi:hypothetical protein